MTNTTGKATVGKKICPTCNQVINSRVLKLRKAHVSALIKSMKYMARHKVNKFNIKDIEGQFTKTEYANFNETKKLLPQAVWGQAGEYQFDPAAVMDFLQGGEVTTAILITPLQDNHQVFERGTIDDVRGTSEFIAQNKWITEYKKPELKLSQLGLL